VAFVTQPVSKVEFGFTQTSAGVYTFQDITEYVRSVEVSRGLSRDLDSYSAASCSVTLDNRDRAFDPSYSSSPFYGQVKPQAAVRVTSGGELLFTGYVDSWAFDYSIVGDQTATFNALDGTTRIASAVVPPQAFSAQFAGARIASVVSSTAVGWAGGTVLDAGQYLLDTDIVGDDVSAWDYVQQVAASDGGAAFINGSGQLVFKSGATSEYPSTRTTYRYNVCKVPGFESATTTGWAGGARSTTVAYKGSYSYRAATTGSTITYDETTGTYVTRFPYMFSFYVYTSVAGYIDWAAGFRTVGVVDDRTTGSTYVSANTWTRISALSTPTIAGEDASIYLYKTAGDSLVYVDAVLIEQTSALGEYFDGTYGPTDTASIDYSQAWDGTANSSTSTLTIVTTYPPNTSTNVALSDAGGTAVPYTNISVVYGSELTYNKTIILRSVTSTGGTATNAAYGTAYGVRVYAQTDSLIGSDANAQNLANYYLGIYEEPELRVESVSVDLHAIDGDQQALILNQDLWGGADVTFTPGGVGSAISSNQKIIGIKHQIGLDTHRIEFALAANSTKFRLDSNLLGVLDQNKLGY
jgi:hypothetical protein